MSECGGSFTVSLFVPRSDFEILGFWDLIWILGFRSFGVLEF